MNNTLNVISIILLSTVCVSYKIVSSKTGLNIEKTTVIEGGCENGASNGTLIVVHYTGAFENGTKFDSSYDRNEPLQLIFNECPSTLIPGWIEGLQGMCVGEERKLIVPPHLGYGEQGKGVIPPNTTLHFNVKLIEIDETPSPESVKEIQMRFNCKSITS